MSVLVVVVVLDDGELLGVVDDVVELVLLEPGIVLLVVPLGVVVVVVLDVSVDGVDGVVVLLVVVDEELLPVAGAGVGAEAGVTSTLVLEEDEGGVVVSVFVQPTTPTPTARRAARRYDDFIVGFPSLAG